jgi:hypothetical protein
MPLFDTSDGFEVIEIRGLGPVSADLVFSDFGIIDGEDFQAGSRGKRNIVMEVGLHPNVDYPDAADLRERLYDWFSPKAEVNLMFSRRNKVPVDIVGRVETCEPAIFTQDPTMSISILCGFPDFRALDDVSFDGATTEGVDPDIVMYEGTAENGFMFTMTVDRDISGFVISRGASNGPGRSLSFNGALETGDKIEISTVERAKGAWLTRDGVKTSVLYGVRSSSDEWINLKKGENDITVYTAGAPIPYRLDYLPKYVGL